MMGVSVEHLNDCMGPCPECGKSTWWYNDVPLTAFCWGKNDNSHEEVAVVVPSEYLEESD